MNGCPTLEEIISFAVEAPTADKADLASHILFCPECRESLSIALSSLHGSYSPSPEDLQEAHVAVRALGLRRQTPKCDAFRAFVSNLVGALSRNPLVLLTPDLFTVSLRRTSALLATPKRITPPYHTTSPEILFVATAPKNSRLYWEARMRLPLVMQESSTFPIELKDGNGLAIQRALLNFRGIIKEVLNGRVELSFLELKASMAGEGLYLEFADGTRSSGEIELT